MPTNPRNVYELMENDDGEIMLLLYAGENEPQKSSFFINEKKKNLELYRNSKDTVIIEELVAESISKLKKIDTLYICEMKYNTKETEENEILYAYTATKEEKSLKEKELSVSDKAKLAREKITKKA